MKVSAAKISPFLRSIPSEIRAILIYGPDAGSVRDHAAILISDIVEDPSDAFRLTLLQPEALANGSRSLVDEINALTFATGRRVVNLRNADDSSVAACSTALDLGRGDTLLIVEAGELAARSKLRSFFEKAPNAAAIPCYAASQRDLQSLAESIFAEHNVTATRNAYDAISRHLGSDHLVSRRELEKLAIFCTNTGQIDASDVAAVLANVAALSLDDVVYSVANGSTGALDRHLTQLFQDKTAGVTVIRAVSRHFQRLWQVQAAIGAGKPIDSAMSGLRPPVFWKFKDEFSRQLRRWSVTQLAAASQRLLEAEMALKSTGAPEHAITERCLLSIAGIPRR